MATQRLVQVLDDMDGEVGAATRTFGLDGATYEIDLSNANAERLHAALWPFIERARRVRGTNGKSADKPKATSNGSLSREDNQAIRAWWKANQRDLSLPAFSPRGRIPISVVDRYRQPAVKIPTVEVVAPTNSAAKVDKRSKPVPATKELLSVYNQAGSYSAVADFFKVSTPTATKWVKAALAD